MFRLTIFALCALINTAVFAQPGIPQLAPCGDKATDAPKESIQRWQKLVGMLGVAEDLSALHRGVWESTFRALHVLVPEAQADWSKASASCIETPFADTTPNLNYTPTVLLLIDWLEYDESGVEIAKAIRQFQEQSKAENYWQLAIPDPHEDRANILSSIARTPLYMLFHINVRDAADEMYLHILQYPEEPEMQSSYHDRVGVPDEAYDEMGREYLGRMFRDVSDTDLEAYLQFLNEVKVEGLLQHLNRYGTYIVSWNLRRASSHLLKYLPPDANVIAAVFGAEAAAAFNEQPVEIKVETSAEAAALVVEAEAIMSYDRTSTYSPSRIMENMERVITFDPTNVRAHALRGIAMLFKVWQGDDVEGLPLKRYDVELLEIARAHLKTSLELLPDQDDVAIELAYVEFNLENFDVARTYLEQAIARRSNYPFLFIYLGHLELQLGNRQASIESYIRTFTDVHPMAHSVAVISLMKYHYSKETAAEIGEALSNAISQGSISRTVAEAYATTQLDTDGDLSAAIAHLESKDRTDSISMALAKLYLALAYREHMDADGFPTSQGSELIRLAQETGAKMRNVAWELIETSFDDAVALMIRSGIDLRKDPKTPTQLLYRAITLNKLTLAGSLIELETATELPGDGQFQPLHVAVRDRNIEAVELLLEGGADPDALDRIGRRAIELVNGESTDEADKIRRLFKIHGN